MFQRQSTDQNGYAYDTNLKDGNMQLNEPKENPLFYFVIQEFFNVMKQHKGKLMVQQQTESIKTTYIQQ